MTDGAGVGGRMGYSRLILALFLVAALVGAAAEAARRLDDVVQLRRGPAQQRAWLLYGPYGEVFSHAQSHLPPRASVLLFSDWDPALLPYYLYPRRIYQLEVDPETNSAFMVQPPSPYPRRRPESFAVDWVIRLRNQDGALVPEFTEARRP